VQKWLQVRTRQLSSRFRDLRLRCDVSSAYVDKV
jgi:hypothetical protein